MLSISPVCPLPVIKTGCKFTWKLFLLKKTQYWSTCFSYVMGGKERLSCHLFWRRRSIPSDMIKIHAKFNTRKESERKREKKVILEYAKHFFTRLLFQSMLKIFLITTRLAHSDYTGKGTWSYFCMPLDETSLSRNTWKKMKKYINIREKYLHMFAALQETHHACRIEAHDEFDSTKP